MIEVHALDAWLLPGARHGDAFHALRFLGGFAAPLFLFLAGLSQALADGALARRGVDASTRRRLAARRALALLAVAYGFRAVEAVLGGAILGLGGLEDVLRVDVLNVIAVSLLLAAGISVGRARGPLLAAGAALAIVIVTPLAAAWTHPPSRVLDYLHGSPPRATFAVLNWSAFLLAGAALAPLAAGPRRPDRFLLLGAALVVLGLATDYLPDVYAHQSFWGTSPAWFTIRLGGCVLLTGLVQLGDGATRALSGLALLGRESLVAYVASIELTYGVLATPIRNGLTLPTVVLGAIAMTAATGVICLCWARLREARAARGGAAAPVALAAAQSPDASRRRSAER